MLLFILFQVEAINCPPPVSCSPNSIGICGTVTNGSIALNSN